MPNLTRANTLSPHTSSMMLRMPLCPPCPPLPLSLIAPTAVSRSSYTTSRLELGILYHRHSDRTDSPLRFMYVWGFARSTGTPAILPTPTFARCLAASVHDMPSVRARMSSTSNPALCLVPSNLEPGLPRPTRSQRPGSATPAPADPWPRTLSIRRIGAVTTLRTTASKPMGAGARGQLPRQHCLSFTSSHRQKRKHGPPTSADTHTWAQRCPLARAGSRSPARLRASSTRNTRRLGTPTSTWI